MTETTPEPQARAVVALAACSGETDAAALPAAAAAATLPPTAPTAAPAAPTSVPPATTSQSPAPATRVTTGPAPKRGAATPTTPRATKAPRTTPPASTSRPAPATSKSAPADASVAGQVLTLVNAERAGRLRPGGAGRPADQGRSGPQPGHGRRRLLLPRQPGRPRFADRIKAAGYPAPRSEDIATGQPTPAAVMDAWMHSPGHKADILDCTATQMGVASAAGGDFGVYWTQDFGTA